MTLFMLYQSASNCCLELIALVKSASVESIERVMIAVFAMVACDYMCNSC